MYSLFYNKDLIGDVLMIVYQPEKIPTSYVKEDDFVKIFAGSELIGINIFNISSIVKIHASGLLPLPANEFVDVINTLLMQHGVEKLEYKSSSGFKIGKIIFCENHPDSEHLHVLKVDIGSEVLDIVCGASNVETGKVVVVATLGTTMFDGSIIKSGKLLGITSNGMCCSERELNLTKDQTKRGLLILEDCYKIGSDFFMY